MVRIVMPLAEGFEDSEFTVPYGRFSMRGFDILIIGTRRNQVIRGKNGLATARIQEVAKTLKPASFDAMVIPGGHSPDVLRNDADMVAFVTAFCATGKLVAAVCHGPQLLIEADAVAGRTLTSWPSVRKDLENAGATWIDEPVVIDGNLITSRKPEDLPAFSDAIEQYLERGASTDPASQEASG